MEAANDIRSALQTGSLRAFYASVRQSSQRLRVLIGGRWDRSVNAGRNSREMPRGAQVLLPVVSGRR